jgi:serine O-acetyltransferase
MIASRADLRAYRAADLAAYRIDRWRPVHRLTQRPAHFQRLLRSSEYWCNVRRDPWGRLVALWFVLRVKLLGERLGYSIPRNVFGPGLSIAHVGTIVVNQDARVGARCRLHQGVTIGEANGRAPVIGDDVHLSPQAVVIGASIGDRVGVRAGAVVVKDVPDDVDVAGVPAVVVGSSVRRPA